MKPFLVDILTPKQTVQLNLGMALWACSAVIFYVWWFEPDHIVAPVDFIFNTLVISWPIVMPGYAFFFVRRLKKPNPALGIPEEWRVACVVTKAPSEPWEVARRHASRR